MSEDNMTLWNAVEKTNPAMTKHVNQRGGFTAICAQYQKRIATEQWGPYGTAWGLSSLLFGYVRDAAGEVIELTLDAEFHYPGGRFPVSADIKYRPGDDCRKKVRTDAMTKALSDLGFNSDVFEGKFDDNKYVNQRRQEEAQQAPAAKPTPTPAAEPPDIPKLLAAANTCKAISEAVNSHMTEKNKPLFAARMVEVGKAAIAKSPDIAAAAKVSSYLASLEYLSAEQLAELNEAVGERVKELEATP